MVSNEKFSLLLDKHYKLLSANILFNTVSNSSLIQWNNNRNKIKITQEAKENWILQNGKLSLKLCLKHLLEDINIK